MNHEDASLHSKDAFSGSAGSVARRPQRQLRVRLVSVFHAEVRLVLVSTGVAATLQADVGQGLADWTPHPAFFPEQHVESDLEPGTFRAVATLFNRMERTQAQTPPIPLLGGLHLSVEFTEGSTTRWLDSDAMATPAARMFARKVMDLAWSNCRHPGLRGQVAALAGYVGRRYAAEPGDSPGFEESASAPFRRPFELLL